MQIRPMTKEDCVQVAAIEATSFSVPWSLKAFTETVEKENFRYFVAEEEGEIIGYCGFLFVLDEAEIPNVCVKSSARKRGVGKQMMSVLMEEAKKLGVSVKSMRIDKHMNVERDISEIIERYNRL